MHCTDADGRLRDARSCGPPELLRSLKRGRAAAAARIAFGAWPVGLAPVALPICPAPIVCRIDKRALGPQKSIQQPSPPCTLLPTSTNSRTPSAGATPPSFCLLAHTHTICWGHASELLPTCTHTHTPSAGAMPPSFCLLTHTGTRHLLGPCA